MNALTKADANKIYADQKANCKTLSDFVDYYLQNGVPYQVAIHMADNAFKEKNRF